VITGIVVALPEELSTLSAKKIAKGRVGEISDNILVICSGAGRENAQFAAELLVAQGASRLISWGCAGALDAELKPGDLMLATSCMDANQVVVEPHNEDWLVHGRACLDNHAQIHIHTGRLAESKGIAATSQDKARLAQATGAIAVDMESIAIAKVAQKHGLPFLSIRAIADPLGMDLPKAVSHALNDHGDVELGKLLIYVLWHPTELLDLIRLGLYFNAAKKTLRKVAKQLDPLSVPSQHK
jgi:adenosylhomocysteine nucleosidase